MRNIALTRDEYEALTDDEQAELVADEYRSCSATDPVRFYYGPRNDDR